MIWPIKTFRLCSQSHLLYVAIPACEKTFWRQIKLLVEQLQQLDNSTAMEIEENICRFSWKCTCYTRTLWIQPVLENTQSSFLINGKVLSQESGLRFPLVVRTCSALHSSLGCGAGGVGHYSRFCCGSRGPWAGLRVRSLLRWAKTTCLTLPAGLGPGRVMRTGGGTLWVER